MKYVENINYDFNEFEQMLSGLTIFDNEMPIAKNIDNANRKPMNEIHFSQLQLAW